MKTMRLIAAALLLTCGGPATIAAAPGETVGHQTHCFTMTPFEDELMLSGALIEPRAAGFWTIFGQWWGGRAYYLEAAGEGRANRHNTQLEVTTIFYNHTPFASGNRWGRFSASIHLDTLQGPWTLAIAGDGRPTGGGSGTPYSISGYLRSKPCRQLGTVPPGNPPNLALAPAE